MISYFRPLYTPLSQGSFNGYILLSFDHMNRSGWGVGQAGEGPAKCSKENRFGTGGRLCLWNALLGS